MKSSSTPRPASPYRRRRIIWTVAVLTILSFLYFFTNSEASADGRWSLPVFKSLSFGGTGISHTNSRVSKVSDALAAERRLRVQEIHGLLHFVTAHQQRKLNEEDGDTIKAVGVGSVKVDPTKKVDFSVYSPDGDDNWQNHVSVLKKQYPLVVFSKTYCPYSRRAKALLESYNVSPPPFVVELDTRSDGPVIQAILKRITGRGTVPNVILQASSIGGSDGIAVLDQEGKLKELLEEAGLTVQIAE
ncbi:hypothetical protein EIP91_011747 [Steccherinum ochraceum]|uniref:Glutaredoxin domain-containing protein n=1 Tax=Steccherinum ochraceum TaxID=92696 RepID=A0A4R0S1R6_9APHY|nr:hypothetical protein EIP91_011747 [Steccherinum ochraceum]